MKKLNINTFEKIYKEFGVEKKEIVFPVEDGEITILVNPTIELNQVIEFVNDVVSRCVSAETKMYYPALQDFLIRKNVLERYTNLVMPKDVEKCSRFIYGTNIFEQVCQEINQDQLSSTIHAIRSQTKYEVKKMNSSSKFDELCEVISGIVTRFAGQFDNIDVQEFMKKVKQMENLDEKRLVDAIVDNIEAKKTTIQENQEEV